MPDYPSISGKGGLENRGGALVDTIRIIRIYLTIFWESDYKISKDWTKWGKRYNRFTTAHLDTIFCIKTIWMGKLFACSLCLFDTDCVCVVVNTKAVVCPFLFIYFVEIIYISMFWNSSIIKAIRYILVIPFQITLLGIYTWIVTFILAFIALALIGKWWWVFLLIFSILYFFSGLIEYIIFLLQLLFNFSGIKLSPSAKFGKITLLFIWLIYTAYVFYGIWVKDDMGFGVIWKIIISYLYIHFVTKWIVLMTATDDLYNTMNDLWNQIKELLSEKFKKIFPNKRKKDIKLNEEELVWVYSGHQKMQYFTIPFWRFFLMQFLTWWLYLAYWTGKNKEYIIWNNYKWYNLWWIFWDAIFKSLLARHIKSKLLVTILSLFLGLWLLVPILISFYILFVQKNIYGFGLFQITNLVWALEKIGNMDFKYALLLIAIVILCIIFYFFPFLLAQYFTKKYHKKSWIPQYTAKFWVFEICMYIVWIVMIYFTINWDLEWTESSAWITWSSQVMDQKEEIIWKEYKSSTWSFQVMTPWIIEYSRQEDKENNTDEIIDVYKSSIKNTDIVLMITHDQLDKEFSLKWISVKEIYKSLMKSYTVSEELSYNEIEWEAHYIAKITHEKQPLYIKWRIIKKNNNEAYNIFSIYTDISSKQLANKFIDSFKFIWQK